MITIFNIQVEFGQQKHLDPFFALLNSINDPHLQWFGAGCVLVGEHHLFLLIDQQTYHKLLLEDIVLPWSQKFFGNKRWTFQQVSTPAHRAKDWCKTHFSDFMGAQGWPPYSPDLIPMDYYI